MLISLQSNPSFVLDRDLSFRYEDRSVPTVQDTRDVIVRIVATGVCGSDVSLVNRRRTRVLLITM
jgi:threonine dehydrogenase-like Zn-dependent dehydrogenase